jgi:hypothetical protein
MASLQQSVAMEAGREGDGSALPSQMLAAVEAVGQIVIDMATEEVGELLAGLREGDGTDVSPYYYPECCYLSASTMGLEKADADELFAKALEAHEKRGGAFNKRDTTTVVEVTEDEVTTMAKAAGFEDSTSFVADLAKRAKELDDIKPKVEELTKFVAEFKNRPMPKAPITGVVEKAADVIGQGGAGGGALTPLQKAEQALAGLSGEEIARMAIKLSHASGGHQLTLNP